MLRSLMAKLKIIKILASASFTATANLTGVNTAGFGSLMFSLVASAFVYDATNKITIIMQHSDTDVDGDYVACAAADIYNPEDGSTGTVKILDAEADGDAVHNFHYLGNKQYVRLRLVEGGTTTGAISVSAILGHPQQLPPA